MRPLALTALILFLVAYSYGQQKLCGEYVTNFPAMGLFAETLTLNGDSSAVLHCHGDLINDRSFGCWAIQGKILTIFFDATNHTARYRDTLQLRIRGKRLYRIRLTRKTYREYKAKMDDYNRETGEVVQIPTFRALSGMPKSAHGKISRQYFRKSKACSCEPAALQPG